MSHKGHTFGLILILLIAFWLRVTDLATMPPGISTDESFNAADSFILAQTGHLPLYEDLNRPEHLHRIILAVGSLFGSSVWAFRLMQVFAGVITVALADWATRQTLPDLPRPIRQIAGLAAAGSLAVAMSHVVLSRSLYRGLWQPVWMLLFFGFLMRGLRTSPPEQPLVAPLPILMERGLATQPDSPSPCGPGGEVKTKLRAFWRNYHNFILSGLALGLALHTYTAALVVPLGLPVLALSLLIFRFRQWRRWLPGLVLLGVTAALITAPIMVMLLTDQDRVLTRATDLESELTRDNIENRFDRVWRQITTRGDINSQYNADYAPILPPTFDHLFMLGLIALGLRLRHPSSALLASLLLLGTLPVMMAGEIPHGHRIVGEFAVFPVIMGVGVGAVLGVGEWFFNFTMSRRGDPVGRPGRGVAAPLQIPLVVIALALLTLTITNARDVSANYRAWWDNNDHPWEVYGRELTHG
ncbi:MAG: hypothetical protein JXA10_11325, partial [Anaerolineae bacterium]|nr:hypothetical protein [Anaerolineae bacterium]